MVLVQETYLPAAGHDWALPLYDPLIKLLGGDSVLKTLLAQARILPGHRVLDIGCGTGTLAVRIKRSFPGVDVTGLDPDPHALDRARRKARRAGVTVRLDRGFSEALPYASATFDRVFSSFMFHHLPAQTKLRTLVETRRVLIPGGSFHMVDFGGSKAHASGRLARLFHSDAELEDNSEDRVLALLNQAGFAAPRKILEGSMFLGGLRLAYYRA